MEGRGKGSSRKKGGTSRGGGDAGMIKTNRGKLKNGLVKTNLGLT